MTDNSPVLSPSASAEVAMARASSSAGCGCGKPSCSTCGPGAATINSRASMSGYVYALGRIEPRFPNLSVEKELAQATARAETIGLSDRQAVHAILSKPENAYIARQLCWVLSIEGIDAYVLLPRDSSEVHALVQSLRPTPKLTDIDVVIGTVGPAAPTRLCNGLELPTVMFAQIYSFDADTFVKSLAAPKGGTKEQFAGDADANKLLDKERRGPWKP